jgi:outer membrane protein OmpA-like peptidoglycan-associated protein
MCGNEEVFRVYNALGRPCRLMPDGSANPDWKQDQAAAVAPRPPLEPFTVYFDSGKSDLSPIAMGELDRAAAAFNDRRSCCVKVVISGHTDRAGTAQANEELSAQRAEVARAYLTSKGIPPEVQLTVALGEKAPAVPTPDGVANPLNRRVEIIMGPWSGM